MVAVSSTTSIMHSFSREVVLLSLTFVLASASLPQVPPIVWTASQVPVLHAPNRTTIIVQIPDVCAPLRKIEDIKIRRGLLNWCSDQKEKNLVIPLEKYCEPSYVAGTSILGGSAGWRRAKRSPQANDPEAGPVRSGDDWVSLVDFNAAQNQISDLLRRLSELSRKQDAVIGRETNLENSIRNLNVNVANLESNIRNMQGSLENLSNSTLDVVLILAPLTVYFQTLPSKFLDLAERQNLKLLDIMTADAKTRSEFKSATINFCHVDTNGGIVHFDVNKTAIAEEIQILAANPFTLYHTIPNSANENLAFKLEYKGPSHAVYNVTSQCVVPTADPIKNAVILPVDGDCPRQPQNAASQYWRLFCEPTYFRGHESIQIKQVEDQYFVYCFGHEINVFKKKLLCPNYVFSLHQNETFEILGVENVAIGTVLGTKSSPDNSEAISAKITNHLMPGLLRMMAESSTLAGACSGGNRTTPTGPAYQNLDAWPASASETESSSLPLVIAVGALIVSIISLGLAIYVLVSSKRAAASKKDQQPYQMPMLS